MLKAIHRRLKRRLDPIRRRLATRHLHGPRRVELAEDQVMLVALLRDAEWFLPHFLDHHFALGVAHVLVIDNGSTDRTVEICRRYDRLTVLHNPLAARQHESGLRAELAQRLARGGWLMFADADELIETPVPLQQLTRWCNGRGHTAVLGQMLDRFSLQPYGALRGLDYAQAVAALDRHSLHSVRRIDYHDRDRLSFHWFLRDNRCAVPQQRLAQGGIRAELFGEDPFLSKHSLVRNLPGLQPMVHPHCASGVDVADVDLLLNHYKLAGDWIARDSRSVQAGYWAHGEDALRLRQVGGAAQDELRLAPVEPLPWQGIAALQKAGFLQASPDFLAAHAPVGGTRQADQI